MKKLHRFELAALVLSLMFVATNASANWKSGLRFPVSSKAETLEATRKLPRGGRYQPLPRPKLACYPTSSYLARFGNFSWTSTSVEDADGDQPNPTFLMSRVTDVQSLDIDFKVDAADCDSIAAEGFFKVTYPGRSGADLPWNPVSMSLVASKGGNHCTFRFSSPMSVVDALIDALPVHLTGEAPRIHPENEFMNEHYLAFIVRARDTQEEGCGWNQHGYLRLREGASNAGSMEWDESSWNTDFDPKP